MPLQTTNNLPYLGVSNAITGAGTVQLPTSGKIDEQYTKAVTTSLPTSAYGARFTIAGGRVLMKRMLSTVTTVIQTQANATKVQFVPTSGDATVDLCATLDITADAVNTIYGLPAAFATAWTEGLDLSITDLNAIVLMPGTVGLNCAATNTGAIQCEMWWTPIDPGATVVGA